MRVQMSQRHISYFRFLDSMGHRWDQPDYTSTGSSMMRVITPRQSRLLAQIKLAHTTTAGQVANIRGLRDALGLSINKQQDKPLKIGIFPLMPLEGIGRERQSTK